MMESSPIDSELNADNVEDLTNLMKQKINFYQQEVARMESMFLKLGIIEEQSKKLVGSEYVEKLSDLQQKLNIKEMTQNAAVLAYADKLRNQNNCAAKLKIYLKMYLKMNEALKRKLKEVKNNHEQARDKVSQIVTVTPNEFKVLEQKISRYEQELSKIQRHNPWLKNKDLNLKSIENEVKLLKTARSEKEELLKELSIYQGLKPDIQEANEQLMNIKSEYKEVTKRFLQE